MLMNNMKNIKEENNLWDFDDLSIKVLDILKEYKYTKKDIKDYLNIY